MNSWGTGDCGSPWGQGCRRSWGSRLGEFLGSGCCKSSWVQGVDGAGLVAAGVQGCASRLHGCQRCGGKDQGGRQVGPARVAQVLGSAGQAGATALQLQAAALHRAVPHRHSGPEAKYCRGQSYPTQALAWLPQRAASACAHALRFSPSAQSDSVPRRPPCQPGLVSRGPAEYSGAAERLVAALALTS
jgi:hypothetical protein